MGLNRAGRYDQAVHRMNLRNAKYRAYRTSVDLADDSAFEAQLESEMDPVLRKERMMASYEASRLRRKRDQR